MKTIKQISYGLLLLLVPAGAYSQTSEKWSLTRCIDYAIEHNINVKQQVINKQNQEIQLNTDKNSRLPTLNANAGQNFNFGRSQLADNVIVDRSSASSSVGISTGMPVFTGFRIKNTIESSKLRLLASIEDLQKAKEDLSIMICANYLQVLFSKEMLRISEEQVVLSKDLVKKTELLVEAGKSPESELFESRAALARDELSLTQARNNNLMTILDLTQSLNIPQIEGFDIEVPDTEMLTALEKGNLVSPATTYEYAVGMRPGIKAANYMLQQSEKQLKIAQSQYWPQLSFGASYGTSYYHTYQLPVGATNKSLAWQFKNNGGESLGLSLSIPIFNRFTVRNQIKQAKLNIINQQMILENTKLLLHKEIQQAYYNAVAARDKMKSSELAVEAAKVAFSYEKQKLSAGKSTSFQYNDAKTKLERSLSEQTQARFDFIFRSKILDFYNGKTITL